MSDRSVEQRLFEEPFAFDFFQAVRLLRRLQPERALVGVGGPPTAEIVRFRALPSLTFPPSSLYDLARATGQKPPLMTVTFFGLTGPNGALPRHYTELIMRLERERKGEERRAMREWFDLFDHRFISVFVRAWEKYRFWIAYERGDPEKPEPDTFSQAMVAFVGLGTGGLRQRLHVQAGDDEHRRILAEIDDRSLLYYAGLLMQRPRNAIGLQAVLSDYFGVPVAVRQFQGQWLLLGEDNQTRLGLPDANAELGLNTVAGERVWDVQGKARLRVGPLTYPQFLSFIPDHSAIPEHKAFLLLCHLARFYAGPELDFDIQLILKADGVPECQLVDDQPGARLGWNAWLVSQQPMVDAEDAVFEAEEIVRLDETTFA